MEHILFIFGIRTRFFFSNFILRFLNYFKTFHSLPNDAHRIEWKLNCECGREFLFLYSLCHIVGIQTSITLTWCLQFIVYNYRRLIYIPYSIFNARYFMLAGWIYGNLILVDHYTVRDQWMSLSLALNLPLYRSELSHWRDICMNINIPRVLFVRQEQLLKPEYIPWINASIKESRELSFIDND